MLFSRKDLWKLLGPLIIEQVLAVLVGMVDVLMVAAVGEAAVSGVALVDSISILIIQLLAALATGGAVICAQYIGKQRPDQACQAAGQLLLITAVCSMVFAGVALAGGRGLLGVIFGRVEAAVMDNAATYFWITALSYPFLAVYNSGAALFRSMGNSRISMMASLIMNGINIAGNAICIFGLHMGVEGVAIPTLISRMFAAVLIMLLLCHKGNIIRLQSLSQLKPERHMIRRILGVGIPSGLESGMFQFGKLALQSLVATLGTASIAGFAVANNLATLQYLTGNALGLGIITIVGQCIGAGQAEQAKMYTKKLVAVNYGILLIVCTVMIAAMGPITDIYNLSPEAAELTRNLMIAHSLAMIIWPPAFTLPHALRAGMDIKFSMAVSVASMWIFRIGFGYVFVTFFHLGVMGIWYGMFIDWAVRTVLFVWRFKDFSRRVRRV